MRPSGFLRCSVEKKSKMNRKVKPSGIGKDSGTPVAWGATIGSGMRTTGHGAAWLSSSTT